MAAPLTRRFVLSALPAAGLVAAVPAIARVPESPEASMWRGMMVEDASGRAFQLGMARAPVTLVTMWAHWCPGCLVEAAPLADFAASLGPKVEVLLLSHPEWWQQDRAYTQQRRINLRHVVPSTANDPAVIRAALTPRGAFHVPRSLALRNGDADVSWKHSGWTDWSSSAARTQVAALAG